jgi:hypothetical protein
MAGTIKRVNLGNSLVYSIDTSSELTESCTLTQSPRSEGCAVDLEVNILEFDLRNAPIDDCGLSLCDAPNLLSEPVLVLEDTPSESREIETQGVCSTAAVTPDYSSPVCKGLTIHKDQSKLAQLVEQLIDSPKKTRAPSGTRPGERGSSPIVAKNELFSGFVPLTVRRRIERQQQEYTKHNISRKSSLKLKRVSEDRWVCPDSWIPNHRCDTFCWETLRTSL